MHDVINHRIGSKDFVVTVDRKNNRISVECIQKCTIKEFDEVESELKRIAGVI